MGTKKIEFNINDYINVKLTDKGRAEIKARSAAEYKRLSLPPRTYPLYEEDANGWSRWQFWGLLEALGCDFHCGLTPGPFESFVEFEVATDLPIPDATWYQNQLELKDKKIMELESMISEVRAKITDIIIKELLKTQRSA